MITSRECKERAAECREMARREPNPHVQAVLNDMARTWERLSIQAAQFTNQAQLGFFFATVRDGSALATANDCVRQQPQQIVAPTVARE